MASSYLQKYGHKKFSAESAGVTPGNLNALAVEVMMEDGIDISNNPVNDVFDFFKQGKMFDYVITVCDTNAAESCPVFPSMKQKISWSFSDPSQFKGTHDEKLVQTRIVRNQIKDAVMGFIDDVNVLRQ
jgi:arsenate reductase